jgi:hypothetical protein
MEDERAMQIIPPLFFPMQIWHCDSTSTDFDRETTSILPVIFY